MEEKLSVDRITLKRIIKELKKWRAHATTLLSLYIPPGRPISDVVGLREVVTKARDILSKQRFVEVLNTFEEFKLHIAKDDGYVIYGEKDVEEALRNGAVEKLLICEDHPEFEKYEKLSNDSGARLIIVTSSVDEYQWFKDTFLCLAAITRYPITT